MLKYFESNASSTQGQRTGTATKGRITLNRENFFLKEKRPLRGNSNNAEITWNLAENLGEGRNVQCKGRRIMHKHLSLSRRGRARDSMCKRKKGAKDRLVNRYENDTREKSSRRRKNGHAQCSRSCGTRNFLHAVVVTLSFKSIRTFECIWQDDFNYEIIDKPYYDDFILCNDRSYNAIQVILWKPS